MVVLNPGPHGRRCTPYTCRPLLSVKPSEKVTAGHEIWTGPNTFRPSCSSELDGTRSTGPIGWLHLCARYTARERVPVLRVDLYVCLYLCLLSARISQKSECPNFYKFSKQVAPGRGSVFLWRRCDIVTQYFRFCG